jgi:hypothetical protein
VDRILSRTGGQGQRRSQASRRLCAQRFSRAIAPGPLQVGERDVEQTALKRANVDDVVTTR